MTLLAPWFLVGGAVAAAAVAALHFLAWGRPPAMLFPTARFVPDRPARAAARATSPADLLLLALRVALVLLVALALAGPVRSSSGRGIRRVILADVSSAAGSRAEVRDSLRAIARDGDVVIAFDTLARPVDEGDSARSGSTPTPGGSLSVALVAALRVAPGLRARAESLELVIVSPLAGSEIDGATAPLRALWPGRARIARVAAAEVSPMPAVEIAGASGPDAGVGTEDPVIAALGLLPRAGGSGVVRVVRRAPRAEDRAWAAVEGRVLVEWPRTDAPAGWHARVPLDSAGALVVDDVVAIGPFARRWRAGPLEPGTRVVARWVNGEVAATESHADGACIRQVGFNPPEAGDAALRAGFLAVAAALVEPCDTVRAEPVSRADAARLAGAGPLLATSGIAPLSGQRSPLTPWLLGLALIALLAEHFVRERSRE